MKARYIGKTFDPKLDQNFKTNIEEYQPHPCNGKVYEIESVSPITLIDKYKEFHIAIKVYEIAKFSWVTIAYKNLNNFIKSWDFNVDPAEMAVGQDYERKEITLKETE